VSPHRLAQLVLLVSLLLPGGLFAGAGVTNCDEWTFVHDGLRLLRGEVIYRDYFQFTPPGTAWLAAFGQAVCGPGVLGPRLLQEAGLVATGLMLHAIARHLGCGPWVAILPALAPMLALHRWIPAFNHHWLVLPWMTAALLLALRGASEARAHAAWAGAGLAAGLACWVLQSDGGVLVLSLLGWLALEAWLGKGTGPEVRRALGWLLGGLGAVLAAGAAWLQAHGALWACYRDCWVWPLSQYRTPGGFNDIPLATDLPMLLSPFSPHLHLPFHLWFYGKVYHLTLLYALYLAPAVLGVLWGIGLLRRRLRSGAPWAPAERSTALVVLLLVGLVAVSCRGRADIIHVACYGWPGLLLAACAASQALRGSGGHAPPLWRPLPALALAAWVGTGALLGLNDIRTAPHRWAQGLSPDASLSDFESVRFIRNRARPGDRIAAWHYAGYWGVYAAPVVGRWNHMTPPHIGYYAPGEYRAFWEGLLRDRPRFVVWCPQGPITPTLRKAEWLWPLPGYRHIATLPHPIFNVTGVDAVEAEIYERNDRPATP
jgi:hypothetical protein